ncbi:MAG: Fatty acid metabolism regulator protein [Syntrophorhabdaceae bacterium PtaU1.Bin034]|jgi:AcrR family transcriptional regulator|nr:MAG: Fatty acid metabolism regulator protein [Syntrophorhabdaceae bacterium PtaU1.Bin034]
MNEPKTSDVREAIIEESIRLFLANGFRGTSVKEITEAAGIGRGTLYWYFKSKDEILESIFRKFEREFVEGLINAVESCEGDFIAKYRVFHKVGTEFARDQRELALASTTLLSEVLGSNTENEKVVRSIYGRYRHFVESMLEEGKREGKVRTDLDTSLYAHVICAGHAGMLVQWFLNEGELDVGNFVRIFRDMILKGATAE